jgi:hypothetical protein
MAGNLRLYSLTAVKHAKDGQGGYRVKYNIFASDSAESGSRILSVLGPGAFELKEHWIHRCDDEVAAIQARARDWHPDLDDLQVVRSDAR